MSSLKKILGFQRAKALWWNLKGESLKSALRSLRLAELPLKVLKLLV